MHPTDDLSVIEPIAASVDFCGKAYPITPMKVGQLPKFARAIKGIEFGDLAALENGDIGAIMGLIADHGESIIDAASVASGIDRAVIEDAESDEMILLVATVMRVNADFFARRLLPKLREQGQAMNGAGQTPSQP
jgi:hypothetical protein